MTPSSVSGENRNGARISNKDVRSSDFSMPSQLHAFVRAEGCDRVGMGQDRGEPARGKFYAGHLRWGSPRFSPAPTEAGKGEERTEEKLLFLEGTAFCDPQKPAPTAQMARPLGPSSNKANREKHVTLRTKLVWQATAGAWGPGGPVRALAQMQGERIGGSRRLVVRLGEEVAGGWGTVDHDGRSVEETRVDSLASGKAVQLVLRQFSQPTKILFGHDEAGFASNCDGFRTGLGKSSPKAGIFGKFLQKGLCIWMTHYAKS